jgi:SulP family sulfate permease
MRTINIFNETSLRNPSGDIFGGITAAVIAFPMALAFGVASGAGAETGLYGAVMVGLFAALFEVNHPFWIQEDRHHAVMP